ncbi:MAG: hypothetical protein SCALA702_28100 [Melioribacteraceae bacterium]|nr:MAG: hypothetical protein SCALA702_28100 [Melioribacteraceae bacterium]
MGKKSNALSVKSSSAMVKAYAELSSVLEEVAPIGHETHETDIPQTNNSLSIDKSGKKLAVIGNDGEVNVYDISKNNFQFITKYFVKDLKHVSSEEKDKFLFATGSGNLYELDLTENEVFDKGRFEIQSSKKFDFVRFPGSPNSLLYYSEEHLLLLEKGEIKDKIETGADLSEIKDIQTENNLVLIQLKDRLLAVDLLTKKRIFELEVEGLVNFTLADNLLFVKSKKEIVRFEISGDSFKEIRRYNESELMDSIIPELARVEGQEDFLNPDIYNGLASQAETLLTNSRISFVNGKTMLVYNSRGSSSVYNFFIGSLEDRKFNAIRYKQKEKTEAGVLRIVATIIPFDQLPKTVSNSRYIFSNLDGIIAAIDTSKFEVKFSLVPPTPINMGFSTSQENVLYYKHSLNNESYLTTLDTEESLTSLIKIPSTSGNVFEISPDKKYLLVESNQMIITGELNHKLFLIALPGGENIRSYRYDDWIYSAAFVEDNFFYIGMDFSAVGLHDAGKLYWNNLLKNHKSSYLDKKIRKIAAVINGSALILMDNDELAFIHRTKYRLSDSHIGKGKILAWNYKTSKVLIQTGNDLFVYTLTADSLSKKRLQENPFSKVFLLSNNGEIVGLIDNKTVIYNPEIGNEIEIDANPKDAHIVFDGNVLALVFENKTVFYSFKTGEELATVQIISDDKNSSFLWTTPPDLIAKQGWFYTNNPNLIKLFQVDGNGNKIEILPESEAARSYFDFFNSKEMILAKLRSYNEYKNNLMMMETEKQNILIDNQSQKKLLK